MWNCSLCIFINKNYLFLTGVLTSTGFESVGYFKSRYQPPNETHPDLQLMFVTSIFGSALSIERLRTMRTRLNMNNKVRMYIFCRFARLLCQTGALNNQGGLFCDGLSWRAKRLHIWLLSSPLWQNCYNGFCYLIDSLTELYQQILLWGNTFNDVRYFRCNREILM